MKRMIRASYNLDPTGKISEAWDKLLSYGISEETLSIITSIIGYSVDTLNKVSRAAFGLSLDQLDDEFSSIDSSTDIKASDSDIPKGYYDDYFGQTAYEEYGDLVAENCAGMIISKRADEGEEPGGLIYEAERLGIEDFFDLLKCLEGMCYNGKAAEISDYQYKVL